MSELYLVHHGILGQKWGKKNGPPYPLAEGDHSAAEKKAARKEKANTVKKVAAVAGAGVAAVGTGMAINDMSKNKKTLREVEARKKQKYWDDAEKASKDGSLKQKNKDYEAKKRYVANRMEEDRELSGPDRADEISKASKEMAKEIKNINDFIYKASKKTEYVGKDVSTMSNKELQDAITRINLENTYIRLNTKENRSKGSEYVSEALEIVGGLVSLAGGIAALMIYTKKEK